VDLDTLQAELTGEVVGPGSPRFETVRRPAIARFADVVPQAVARCATAADVARTLAFARAEGVPVAPRSGGHCFAGRSSTTGLVVDVGPMASVSVDDGAVTVGAGARLGAIYDALAAHGLTIAGGCGPTVGIAGLALGGGLGILGRRHGLTSDQVLAAEIVLADGRIAWADDELLWALRGAGGGEFGVVTALRLRTVPAPAATTLHLTWPVAHAAALLEAWQEWAPAAPDDLAASLLVTAGPDPARAPVVHLFGAMVGTEPQAAELVGQLGGRVGARPATSALAHGPWRETKRRLAEDGPDEGGEDALLFSKSEFFRDPVPGDAAAALVEHLAGGRVAGEARTLDLSPWAGAYARVPADATAFVHRDPRFLLKHDVAVTPGGEAAARAWLEGSWTLVHPWGTGGAYPNFPDPELEDWPRAAYGANLERLRRLKAAYDPDGVFPGSLVRA
jgi:FAD/FMN-containing dehydrogenase